MRIVVNGAKGRMGQTLIRLIGEQPKRFTLVGAYDAGKNDLSLLKRADAIIDFSVPQASVAMAKLAAKHRLVHVIGTTGFSPAEEKDIARAARGAVIVKSGNMSLGVNVLAALVKQVAEKLGPDFDIEILDIHHRNKADAPSGTALLLGKAASEGRRIKFSPATSRTGKRSPASIGFASLRGGSVIGEHEVIFAGPCERITLAHSAEDRAIFVHGALKAALWAKNKKPGLYSMQDVLELA